MLISGAVISPVVVSVPFSCVLALIVKPLGAVIVAVVPAVAVTDPPAVAVTLPAACTTILFGENTVIPLELN